MAQIIHLEDDAVVLDSQDLTKEQAEREYGPVRAIFPIRFLEVDGRTPTGIISLPYDRALVDEA